MMIIISKESIRFVNEALALPASGKEQDWDVELSNPDRVVEFIDYYEFNDLTDDHKYALMALILCSLEDLSFQEEIDGMLWRRVAKLLCQDKEALSSIIDYWSLSKNDASSNNSFHITHLIRSLKCD